MKYLKTYIFVFALLVLTIPSHSFAQSGFSTSVATITVQSITPAQELSSELAQIKAKLDVGTSPTTSFVLSPGQSIQQAATSSSTGLLSVTLPNFLHTQPSSTSAATTQLAKINLTYSPCVTAGVSSAGINVCTAGPTPFPVMTSELQLGQSTNYLNYNIALTQLNATSATFEVTDSSFLSSIQDQINVVAAKVHALLGK